MSATRDSIGEQELRYFGKVTASVSHELKNVLAILNEHAGLLQDFTTMAEQGKTLDVERIRRLSVSMLGQIGRGDAIVKRLNRFAHSADQDRATVDLNELATMVVEMFGRTATTRGVAVEVQVAAAAVNIRTNPFVLEALLGNLLDRLSSMVPDIGVLRIELHAQATSGQISMPGLAAGVVAAVLEADDLKALLAVLGASAAFSRDSDALVITLSGNIDT